MSIVLGVNCSGGNCLGCNILESDCPWGQLSSRGLSCHPYVISTFLVFSVRIEAEDCILLLKKFLFKLFEILYSKDSITNCTGETLTNCDSYISSHHFYLHYLSKNDKSIQI